jgi:hypothetical protein
VDSPHRTARNAAARSIPVEYLRCPAPRWSTMFSMVDHKDTKFRDPYMGKQCELCEDSNVECARVLHFRLSKTSDRPKVHKILYKKLL